ncbi:MAG TPA: DUF3048 domain-containing protein [Nocardioidaceae bacterium]|nr:DUF3048 domain-containing protein [Nocardioidaceae bacterium]
MSFGRLSRRARASRAARTGALVAVPALLALTLAGCGGGDDSTPAAPDNPTDSTDTANAMTLSQEWPLTGEPVDGDLPDHPVYVVKIDNTSSSAPQVGLGSADMIIEELVEGGLSRLAVFFYSDVPDNVGPVRSMRATDVGIVKPARGEILAAGGARPTRALISQAHIVNYGEGSTGFYRSDQRIAPYNLFAHLSERADKPGAHWKAPPTPYLQFGDASDFAGSIKVNSIQATFSAAHTTDWTHTSAGWTRPDSYAESGDDFTADNILLLRVKIGDAGYKDPAGNPVPVTYFYGSGPGVLVHGDLAQKVKWTKHGKAGQLTLASMKGDDVSVPAGHTWIELIPEGTGSVTLN